MSAALKAAQLDSPSEGSPTEQEPEVLLENDPDCPSGESDAAEPQSEIEQTCTEEQTYTEEEQTMETSPSSETCPVQEQEDEETQTEPLEEHEEPPPNCPVLVHDSVVH